MNTRLTLPHRPRRLRTQPWMRELVQEHRLHASDLIWPIFIQEGENQQTPIPTLPGVARLSIDLAIQQAADLQQKGLTAVALFPVTPAELKSDDGAEACNPENLICRAIKAFKQQLPELGLICDVALDPYTTHGHDGLLNDRHDVDNDTTVAALCKQAVVQAQAGADIIAPSDMMDGRIGAIRHALDEAGYSHTAILSYTAKYASALYGPFRHAVGSHPSINSHPAQDTSIDSHPVRNTSINSPTACGGGKGGAGATSAQAGESPPFDSPPQAVGRIKSSDPASGGEGLNRSKSGGEVSAAPISKATYQMSPANGKEAIKEAALDVAEGTDMLMVKPGLPYLDIIASLKHHFNLPIFAYHVSGEYAGVMFAAQHGAIDANAAFLEHMLCFKRAGATAILTYAAPILLELLEN